ncbi:hypothetical protein Gotri_010789 [Gossypium trilobum]|uniref:Uncharacterized protein n=1 Tax=Gossypium trilobum TaxID=34281 RepID=A0A7J9ERK9_9ROSI|nr:hypothetical protein [Gossypium trilobum]
MKLFHRFRKFLMRLLFSSLPCGGPSSTSTMAAKQNNCCDRFDPPKTSCSSYYSSHSHYTEAIADCIEFLNKSSQEGIYDGRKFLDASDASMVRSSNFKPPEYNESIKLSFGLFFKVENEVIYVIFSYITLS